MRKLDRLILASQSEARRRLLRRLGFEFECIPANIDEASYQRKIKNPRSLVRKLAQLKAKSVYQAVTDQKSRISRPDPPIVIGSDQVLFLRAENHGNDLIFGKPRSFAGACRQLQACSGREISLLTAVHIESKSMQKTWLNETRMRFRTLSRQEIVAYVRRDAPLDCSGSFKFELHGIALFDSVKTSDPTAIEGLPLLSLNRHLRSLLKK